MAPKQFGGSVIRRLTAVAAVSTIARVTPRLGRLTLLVILGCMTFTADAMAAQLQVQLNTNRGCIENGDNPVFVVGESIVVGFRLESDTFSQAQATLFDGLSSGVVIAFNLGAVPTNQSRTFTARIAPPTGTEHLQLQAHVDGISAANDCSFTVVTVPRTVTPTSATRTPTPTGTPSASQLHAQITTNRGCRETGQDPVYHVGESIVVSFRFDSDAPQQVQATLLDISANGFVNVFSFGSVPTGQNRAFPAQVAPPLGIEQLQLKGRTGSGLSAQSSCSFTVAPRLGESPTPTHRPFATRTPSPSRTPTATATATATPRVCPPGCNGAEHMTVDDLVQLVRIVFGDTSQGPCPSADLDGNGSITLDEVFKIISACR